jgi:3-oxoacyl-[acyl-carrier-protein] synthase-3
LNGPQILSLALTAFEDLLLFLSELQITLEEIDFVVPHQANRFILDNLIRRYSLDSRKFIVEMNDVGNTSCNSIPLAICIAQEMHNFSNKDCILLGFGNGLSWGALRVKFGQIRLKIAY